jgi:SsrA-binding protein
MKKLLLKNRKARHEYELLDKFEAGIVLHGHEAKSLRNGGGNFTGSFVSLQEGEAFLKNFHIQLYEYATIEGYEAERPRKLLLRKAEIQKITRELNTKGVTLIPLACGLEKGKIKIEIALARGKKQHDKRNDLKRRDQEKRINNASHLFSTD